MLGLAGRKCLSNTLHDATGHIRIPAVQPLPNSYKQWMNAKSYNLCEPHSSSLHRRCGLIKKASDSYQLLHVPARFDFAAEDTDLILGHNLQRILVNIPVVVGHNKMSTTHSGTWRGFRSPCSQFTSWINITCLEGVLCSSISAFLCFSHSHHSSCILSIVSPAPHLQRLRSRRWSEAWQTCRVENTAVTRCPLCAPVTLMTDTHWSPALYCAPPSLPHALWGSELNADNMSSSVHLTLPVRVLAMSSILMQSTPFIVPYNKTLGAEKCLSVTEVECLSFLQVKEKYISKCT